MPRLAVLAFILVLVSVLYLRQVNTKSDVGFSKPVNVLSRDSGVIWEKVDSKRLILIPNFDEKKSSRNVFEENNCLVLVNGGFYSKTFKPIGYFIVNTQKLSDFEKNRLFDGIFSINEYGIPRITRVLPKDNLVNAVQTGPIIFENGATVSLNISRDKPARRIIAAVTGSNELIFIVFYSPSNYFLGPLLSDLPEEIKKLNESEKLDIADAINLDGGSASSFITKKVSLTEASPVGSYFCIQ